MCGIVGIVSHSPVNQEIYDALTVLQHRGQDAAGIVTTHEGRLFLRKDNGLVRDVFRTDHMLRLQGNAGVGHVRYPTAGVESSAEAQPFYVNTPYGICLSHNGNLTNAEQLAEDLFRTDRRHLNTDSDSEILLNVFAHELMRTEALQLSPGDIFRAVTGLHRRCSGGYAATALITGYGLVGFRDPHGIRPVVYGKRETEAGTDYMIASESVALDALGYEIIDDINPGECVVITLDGEIHVQQCADQPSYAPCIFEYVYLSRPDSVIDDVYVYKARLRMGTYLADKIRRDWPDHDIDVVIPIPSTSRTAAVELASQLDVKYREGFIKNRYIGRTFIMPGQQQRAKSVRQKLNPIDLEFADKNVLLVDDSIVRGTTSRQIIEMAREAGARKVYFASAAPPVRYPNVYGIDMPSATELVAHGHTEEEVAQVIGADKLIYQDMADLERAVSAGNAELTAFEDSVFSGQYITADVSADYLEQLELFRADAKREERRNQDNAVLELHNAE
ncbi:amidophosphoribosyltransferase [Salinisphaera orenii]|uniref:Amidophosphoribosyltransferase n=1 Tax=Salinisphaera orenii YIM 95161 TaxID=1051139 RepID=A0A423PEI7_9GAMM|nr:amidophosphoribosyltransferase [Salinisphaera halophila]ROO23933.1 amidophosphoribosyltransferase [Salinisphaera halophila YIM 95161]